jgi:predicted ArsR family transcriptional regulator
MMRILPHLLSGQLDIARLANELQTNPRNIRNDLDTLETAGWLSSTGQTTDRFYKLTEAGRSKAIGFID